MTVLNELDRIASVASFDNDDLRACTFLLRRYTDMNIGLTDAANAVIAGRYKTTRILSLDSHYRGIRPLVGESFDLLPLG